MGSPAYTTTQDLTGGDTARFPGEPRPCPTHWCSSHCEVTQHETSTRVALLACMLLDFALGHTERRHTRPPSRVVAGLGVPSSAPSVTIRSWANYGRLARCGVAGLRCPGCWCWHLVSQSGWTVRRSATKAH